MTPDIPLSDFVLYMLSQPLSHWSPIVDEFYDFGKVTSIILHRWENYQVELFFIMPGETTARLHTHRNVDTYEMAWVGKVGFVVEGVRAEEFEESIPIGERSAMKVDHDQIHAAYPETPGAFLSFQKWLNGVKPTSVGSDWQDECGDKRDLKKDIEARDDK